MKNFIKSILKLVAILVILGLAAVGAVFLIVAIKNHFAITYEMLLIYSGGGILMFLGVIKFFELLINWFKFLRSLVPSSIESKDSDD